MALNINISIKSEDLVNKILGLIRFNRGKLSQEETYKKLKQLTQDELARAINGPGQVSTATGRTSTPAPGASTGNGVTSSPESKPASNKGGTQTSENKAKNNPNEDDYYNQKRAVPSRGKKQNFSILLHDFNYSVTEVPPVMYMPEGYPYVVDPEVYSAATKFYGIPVDVKGINDLVYAIYDDSYLINEYRSHPFVISATGGPGNKGYFKPYPYSVINYVTGNDGATIPATVSSSSAFFISRQVFPPVKSGETIYGQKNPIFPFKANGFVWTEEIFVKFGRNPFTGCNGQSGVLLYFYGMFGYLYIDLFSRDDTCDYEGFYSDIHDIRLEVYLPYEKPYSETGVGYADNWEQRALQGNFRFLNGVYQGNPILEYSPVAAGGPGQTIVLPGLGISAGQRLPAESKWYHVAWVSDGSAVSIYFNGQLTSKLKVPPATPYQRKYNETYYATEGWPGVPADGPYNWGYGIGPNSAWDYYGPNYLSVTDTGIAGYMEWSALEPGLTQSYVTENFINRVGMSQYRFTANKALYSGTSFTPPDYIDKHAL